MNSESFNPLTQVSADAKYIVKHIVLWFFIFGPLLGVLLSVLYPIVSYKPS